MTATYPHLEVQLSARIIPMNLDAPAFVNSRSCGAVSLLFDASRYTLAVCVPQQGPSLCSFHLRRRIARFLRILSAPRKGVGAGAQLSVSTALRHSLGSALVCAI